MNLYFRIAFVFTVLLQTTGCDRITYGHDIYSGQSFCFVHKNVTLLHPEYVKKYGIHSLDVNGEALSIYEGSGVRTIDKPNVYISENGWRWEYGEADGNIILQHNKKNGEGFPPQLNVEFKANNSKIITVSNIAESFRDKKEKCSTLYLK